MRVQNFCLKIIFKKHKKSSILLARKPNGILYGKFGHHSNVMVRVQTFVWNVQSIPDLKCMLPT